MRAKIFGDRSTLHERDLHKCGEKGERNKWQFKCRRCGYIACVDKNTSRNIALKARKAMSMRRRSP